MPKMDEDQPVTKRELDDDAWYPPDDDFDDRMAEYTVDSDPNDDEREFPPAP